MGHAMHLYWGGGKRPDYIVLSVKLLHAVGLSAEGISLSSFVLQNVFLYNKCKVYTNVCERGN